MRASSVVALAVGIFAVTYAYRMLSFIEFSNDDFVHLSMAQQMMRGDLPVRDFVERGLPLMAALSAVAQRVVGVGLWTELQLVSAAFALSAALCAAVAARLSGSLVVGGLLGMVPALIYPVPYAYPKLLAYAIGMTAAIAYVVRPSARRLLATAAAVVAAFLLRHDHGVILAVGIVPAIVVLRRGLPQASPDLARFVGAGLLLIAPFLTWVQVYQGLGDYLEQGVRFSRREGEKATWGQPPALGLDPTQPAWVALSGGAIIKVRWQPDASASVIARREAAHGLIRQEGDGPQTWQYELRDWSPAPLERLVKDPAAADTNGFDRATFTLREPLSWYQEVGRYVYVPGPGLRLQPNAIALFYYFVWALPVLTAIALVFAWKGVPESLRAAAVMGVIVQLAVNYTMLRDPLSNRIREVVVPVCLLLAVTAGMLWGVKGPTVVRAMSKSVVLLLLVAVIVTSAVIGDASNRISYTGVAAGVAGIGERADVVRLRLAPPQDRTGDWLRPEYQELVTYVRSCTAERSRIFTIAFAPELFFYTGRSFAGGQVSLTPGYYAQPNDEELMLRRLSAEDVPLVVVDDGIRGEMAVQYPRIAAHLAGRYREVANFAIATGRGFVVLADTKRPSVRPFGARSLPCFVPAS